MIAEILWFALSFNIALRTVRKNRLEEGSKEMTFSEILFDIKIKNNAFMSWNELGDYREHINLSLRL